MTAVALIGGTGLTVLEGLEVLRRDTVETTGGPPSEPLIHGLVH